MVIRGVLLTWDNLMKRNWEGLNVCVLCTDNGESIDHLFTTCPYTVQVWGLFAQHLSIHIPHFLDKAIMLWSTWRFTSFNKEERVI